MKHFENARDPRQQANLIFTEGAYSEEVSHTSDSLPKKRDSLPITPSRGVAYNLGVLNSQSPPKLLITKDT